MHALHLPPRHLWRATLLAALLTVIFMAGLLATAAELNPGDSARLSPAPPQEVVATPQADKPIWLSDPLAPPTVTLSSGR